MSGMRALRSVLALAIILVVTLWAVPAYPWHGTGNITALAIDPVTPTTLYAGTSDRGVFKSTDGGASWSAAGFTNIAVTALAIDARTPTTLYAGAGIGVFKSTDGGASWSATGFTNIAVTTLAIDARTPTTLYAGTPSGLFKSTNGAASWLAINIGLPNPYVADLAIDPQTPATLYALVPDAGVFKSTDGGATWNAVLRNEWFISYQTAAFQAVAINPQLSTTLYVYVFLSTSEMEWGENLISTDGGTNWVGGGPNLRVLAIDPKTSTTLYAVGTDATWWTPPTVDGVLKSMDEGATWIAVNTGLTDTLLAYGVGPCCGAVVIDPVTPTILYASTSIGVFKSTDGAASWSPTSLIQHSPLSSLSLSTSGVAGGTALTGTVTLVTAAPAGGVAITLSSSHTAVATVPSSVTVPEGATSANFAISTNPEAPATNVTIYATLDDATRLGFVYVVPVPLSSLSLDPTSVIGGTASTGTVTLTVAAPAGGAVVALSSSNPTVATVPTSVTVAAGATSASFEVSTKPVTASTYVGVSGTYRDSTKGAWLDVTPAPATLSSLSLNPTSVPGGTDSVGTVTLSAAAPGSGAVVALSSSNPAVAMVPASVTVVAGATSASFRVYTAACASETVTISEAYGSVTRSAGLTVTLGTTDTVAIQTAEYFARKQVLRVGATSTSSPATLSVFDRSSGESIGTLTHFDGGKYRGQFTWPVNPLNIRVRSSLCGEATSAVTTK